MAMDIQKTVYCFIDRRFFGLLWYPISKNSGGAAARFLWFVYMLMHFSLHHDL